jgi:RNA polymerase II-associated factor 1
MLTKANKNKRVPEPAADSPHAIKRKIDKGFEIAEQEFNDPKRAKHPSKRHLKVVDVSPLIPDLDAFPDTGAYVTIKFHQAPVVTTKQYDRRLLSGLFKPIDRTPEEEEAYEAAIAAHEQDPDNVPKPQNSMNYEYYLAASAAAGERFRRKFDVEDADHNEDELYTHQSDAGGCFQFRRLRGYETAQEVEFEAATKYDEEIILSYNEDTFYPNQKAVYYYPVQQKSVVRPQRTKNIARNIGIADEEQVIDQLDITVEHRKRRSIMKSTMRVRMLKVKRMPTTGAAAQRPVAQGRFLKNVMLKVRTMIRFSSSTRRFQGLWCKFINHRFQA